MKVRRFIIFSADSLRKIRSDRLKLCSFCLTKNDHKTDAILSGIQGAQRFAASAVFILIIPVSAACIPYPFHFVFFINRRTKSLPQIIQRWPEQCRQAGFRRYTIHHCTFSLVPVSLHPCQRGNTDTRHLRVRKQSLPFPVHAGFGYCSVSYPHTELECQVH